MVDGLVSGQEGIKTGDITPPDAASRSQVTLHISVLCISRPGPPFFARPYRPHWPFTPSPCLVYSAPMSFPKCLSYVILSLLILAVASAQDLAPGDAKPQSPTAKW